MDKTPALTTCLLYFALIHILHTIGTSGQTDLCECTQADQYNTIQVSNVIESAPLNDVIETLSFKGGRGVAVTAQISTPYVAFDDSTYELKVIKNFQVLQHNPLLLSGIKLVCTIQQNGQKIEYQVLIEVQDTNDHSPVFSNQPYVFNVSELTPAGLALSPDIVASDLDPRDAGQLTYSIFPDTPYSDYFNFTIPSKGRLTLQKQLNYQEVQQVVLNIQVKDNSYNYSIFGTYQPQHTVTTTATINVLPISVDMPSFVKHSYTLNLGENYKPSMDITIDPSWQAYVPDGYTFSIVEDANIVDWQSFTIESSSGILRAKGSLQKPQYLLQLKVRRSTQSLFTTTLVLLRRTQTTRFAQTTYNIILYTSTSVGSLVQTLKLTTSFVNCESSMYLFKLEATNNISTYFEVTSDGGILLTKKLDPSLVGSFQLNILLYYNSTIADTAYLNVNVEVDVLTSLEFSRDIYEFQYHNDTYIGNVEIISQYPENEIIYDLASKTKDIRINSGGAISCPNRDCWSTEQPLLVTARQNGLSSCAMVLLSPQTTSQTTSELQTSSVDYRAAFIVAMILACLLLFVILAFLLLLCRLYKRTTGEFEEHCTNISTTFSEGSADPFTQNRKLSKLDKLQGILVNEANGSRKDQTVVGRGQPETDDLPSEGAKVLQKPPIESKNPQGTRDHNRLSDSSLLARTDVNSSQDTINASIMTLTRPAVGTNGITVYY